MTQTQYRKLTLSSLLLPSFLGAAVALPSGYSDDIGGANDRQVPPSHEGRRRVASETGVGS